MTPCPTPLPTPRHLAHAAPPARAGTKTKCEQELAKLDKMIAKKEKELAGISQQATTAAAAQQQLQGELAGKQRRLTALYEKQGRSAQVGGWVRGCTGCMGGTK